MKKINRRALLWGFILFSVILASFLINKIIIQKKIHYHAGFVVIANNKKVNFSDWKYMNIKPCDLGEGMQKPQEDEQLEKAHLHDQVGDVIHIEREGALWKDLFINIHYPIDQTEVTAFIDGEKVMNYEQIAIKKNDRLVLFIGTNDIGKGLKQTPSKSYIELMGEQSKTCGE